MELFITLLGVIVVSAFLAVGIGSFVLLRRALAVNEELSVAISTLEEENTAFLNSNNRYDTWFEEFKNRVVYSYQRIKIIDAKGAFEADDEVGYFFKELKSLIERLHELGIMDEVEKQEALANATAPKITTEELQKVLSQRNAASISNVREEKR